jgi:hypothetical protein
MTQETKRVSEFALVSAMNTAFNNMKGNPDDYRGKSSAPGLRDVVYDQPLWERLSAQLRNIKDEIIELANALASGSVIEVRDALCDIRVFAYGGLHFIGYDMDYEHDVLKSISTGAPIPSMLSVIHPMQTLITSYEYLMAAVAERNLTSTVTRIGLVIWAAKNVSSRLGLDVDQQYADMDAVIKGVMTRFVKDEADWEATVALHESKGVAFTYSEGQYPTMIVKSAQDQPDAPKGKFLKSASYQNTVFSPLTDAQAVQSAVDQWA